MKASGPDITKSTSGRLQGEFVWLPSRFALGDVNWTAQDPFHAKAQLSVAGFTETVSFLLNDKGGLSNISLPRWGNPEGNSFKNYEFGAEVEDEQTFGGYTIPSKLRAGWFFGSDRFEEVGEFFRCTIDRAEFR